MQGSSYCVAELDCSFSLSSGKTRFAGHTAQRDAVDVLTVMASPIVNRHHACQVTGGTK